MKNAVLVGFALLFSLNVLQGQTPQYKEGFAYFCPPCNNDCDKLQFDKEGKCPHCNMKLVKQNIAERQAKMTEKKMKIAFYLQDGVEILDFAGPMEVFVYAGFEVFTVSKKKEFIKSQGILKVMPDYSIDDAPTADILAFFGGNSGAASNDEAVINWVNGQRATTQYHFSVCTGAFVLAKAGLLDNLTITTFHLSIDALKKAVPSAKVLSDVRYVDNGRVITTAGVSAGIDGALYLVSKLKGEQAAKDVAFYMEYDKWTPNQGLIIADKH
jgi:transcriptional regulator GlxA family with amidase domain/DNA-directed RNA polymerase subunit RPC12/RpoP